MSVVLLERNCPGCQENYTKYGFVNRLHPCGHFICPWCYSAARRNKKTCPKCEKPYHSSQSSEHYLYKGDELPLPLPSTIKASTAEEKEMRRFVCVADPLKRAKDDALEEKCPECARNYLDLGKEVVTRYHPCGHFICINCKRSRRKGDICPTCKKTITGWECDDAYMGDLNLQLQQRQQHQASLTTTVENLKGGEFKQKQQQQQQHQKLNCSLCSEDIHGIASVCTTCLDGKYPDWKGMDNVNETLDREAICSECRLEHSEQNEDHVFRRTIRIKNELNSAKYKESITQKLNDSISQLWKMAKSDHSMMEMTKTSLLNTVAALKNSNSTEIEGDLLKSMTAHEELTKKFFGIHDELFSEMERINSSLEKYSQNTDQETPPSKERKEISSENSSSQSKVSDDKLDGSSSSSSFSSNNSQNGPQFVQPHITPPSAHLHNMAVPPPPYNFNEMTSLPMEPPPFLHVGVTDLRGLPINGNLDIFLENVTDKFIQYECKGESSNFTITPTTDVVAPHSTSTLSCRRLRNDLNPTNVMFIECRPRDEPMEKIQTIQMKLD